MKADSARKCEINLAKERLCVPNGSFFLGPCGLRDDFLRLPMAEERKSCKHSPLPFQHPDMATRSHGSHVAKRVLVDPECVARELDSDDLLLEYSPRYSRDYS